MSPRCVRSVAVVLPVALLVVVASACGAGAPPERVASGEPSAESTAAAGAAPPSEGAGDRSPVPGLTPEELRALVAEVPQATVRRQRGPTAERIELADGRGAWRVRVPGSFPMRSSRAFVTIDGRDVGQGIQVPTLDAVVVIVPTDEPLADASAVAVRWEQGEAVGYGSLEVLA